MALNITHPTGPNENVDQPAVPITGKTAGNLRPSFYAQLPLSSKGDAVQVNVASGQADAFGRIRIASPDNLFSSNFHYDLNPLFWVTSTASGGSVTANTAQSSATLSTGGTTSGAVAILQSKRYFLYQAGKSQQIIMTGVMGALKANVTQRIGYFDDNNGVFFQQNGQALSVVVRSNTTGSPVDISIPQSQWNLDKADGTGPSGIKLNTSYAQIFFIDFEWLGTGRVRWGFYFNGILVYVHQFLYANTSTTGPYMNTGSLPVRYEIRNTATADSTTTMLATCQSVASEGGQEFPASISFTASNGITTISVSTRRPILSISPKTTFNGVTNRSQIIMDDLEVITGSNSVFWELVYNGTLTGASFASVDANSLMNFDVAATAITGGTVLLSGFVPGSTGSASQKITLDISKELPITLDFAGSTADILSVVCTSFTGSSATAAALTWDEPRD